MSQYTGNGLKDTIMRFWIKRRDKLVTDYSLVGYMLSPNPKIMAHCDVNKSSLHVDAADRLIEKLILDPMLVGTTRREKLADLIDKFKDEYGEFTSKRGKFAKDNIWMVAASKKRRDSVGMLNIPLRLLRCWEGLPVWCCQRFLGLAQQRGIGSR
jgi:hypothetical protein